MPTPERPTSPGFWRCEKCGAPNPWAAYLLTCIGCGGPRPSIARMDADPAARSGEPEDVAARVRVRKRRSRRLIGFAVGYGVILLIAGILTRVVGDAWWPGEALLLSPRWAFLAPLPILLGWAIRARRWGVAGAVACEVLFVVGPLMGFALPLERPEVPEGGTKLRVMTFNRGKVKLDVPAFTAFIEREKIDLLLFQEFNDDPELEAWFVAHDWWRNSSRWIASRHPIVGEIPEPPQRNDVEERYTARFPRAKVRLPNGREFVAASVHMPTLRQGLKRLSNGNFDGFLSHLEWWDAECRRMLAELNAAEGTKLIAGDFNNGPEAAPLVEIRNRGVLRSAFEDVGIGWGYTRPAVAPWVRIDQILATPDLAATACWVGPAFGSDHRSLLADYAIPPAPKP